MTLREKCLYLVFFLSVFTSIRTISLRIQSECGKIRTRRTPNTDTFHALQLSIWRRELCVTDNKSVLEATIHFIISLDDSTHHSSNNSNGMRTHNHLVCKGTLNHLAKLGELSACRFESRCCHLNFRYRACFKQGVL